MLQATGMLLALTSVILVYFLSTSKGSIHKEKSFGEKSKKWEKHHCHQCWKWQQKIDLSAGVAAMPTATPSRRGTERPRPSPFSGDLFLIVWNFSLFILVLSLRRCNGREEISSGEGSAACSWLAGAGWRWVEVFCFMLSFCSPKLCFLAWSSHLSWYVFREPGSWKKIEILQAR